MADPLTADAVVPLLQGRFGRPYRYEDACESTQRMLGRELPEGAVAVCDAQTAGRGRLGRGSHAPAGTALLCSIVLRPPVERRSSELSLVGGMAAADAVEHALGLTAQIKWSSDVMVNRRRVASVLAEARNGTVVLGIAVNVNQTREQLPSDLRIPAASLFTVDGVRRKRAPILVTLLAALSSTTTGGRQTASTPSATSWARAISCAGDGSRSPTQPAMPSASIAPAGSRSTSAASIARSRAATSRTSDDARLL